VLTDEQKKLLTKAFAEKVSDELSVEMTETLASQAHAGQRFVELFALEKKIIPARYVRNIGSIGLDGQKRLLESSVLVIGLGGLGGFLCEALARAGAGRIFAVDKDVCDQTNLNRQLFCTENNLGKQKAKEAQKRIKQVNNSVEFTAFATHFSEIPQNIWNDVRLVFDCLDNIKDRLILAEKCSQAGLPLVHGAIAGWCGEIATIWPASRLLDKIYKTDTKGIEQNLGTPVFTAATAASIMASVGIKILTDKTQKKDNRILYFDLMENIWQTVNL
jgi:molybdopterin/thiamine biosynthesis adenylyltransferase